MSSSMWKPMVLCCVETLADHVRFQMTTLLIRHISTLNLWTCRLAEAWLTDKWCCRRFQLELCVVCFLHLQLFFPIIWPWGLDLADVWNLYACFDQVVCKPCCNFVATFLTSFSYINFLSQTKFTFTKWNCPRQTIDAWSIVWSE